MAPVVTAMPSLPTLSHKVESRFKCKIILILCLMKLQGLA